MSDSFDTEDLEMDDELELSMIIYNPLYRYFSEQISALKALKDNPAYSTSHAVNIMYVPVLTMFIESCISELTTDFLKNEKANSNDELKTRLIDNLANPLNRGWKQYKDSFKLVFGYSFEDIIDHEIVKAIGYLFELRNKLIHGKQFVYLLPFSDDESTLWGEHYKKINDYLEEKKLIAKNTDQVLTTLVNDMVVDHFLRCTIRFVEETVTYVHRKHSSMMYTIFKAHVIDKLAETD